MEPLEHAPNTELLSALAGKPAAEALLGHFGGLTSLAQASFDELQGIKGIGKSKAAAIKSAFLLAQRHAQETCAEAEGQTQGLIQTAGRNSPLRTWP